MCGRGRWMHPPGYRLQLRQVIVLDRADRRAAGARRPDADDVVGPCGTGIFDGFDAVNRFVEIEAVHTPIEENRRRYLPLMPIFDECYHSLAGVYDRLGEIRGNEP